MLHEDPFTQDDLKVLAIASQALHRDDSNAPARLFDICAALCTLNLNPETRFQRAITALKLTLKSLSPTQILEGLYQPFWNLGPDQRLALALLHLGRSSWSRVSAVLEIKDTSNLGAFFWSARQELVYRSGANEPVPAGPSITGSDCPLYDSESPWAQKFFDEEMPKPERVFIERHLQQCTACADHLSRVRAFYYRADKLVRDAIDLDHLQIPSLQVLNPDPRQQAFRELLSRWDVRIALLALLFLIAKCSID